MPGEYRLEKTVWDDSDFDRMGWHDVTIHAIAFGPGIWPVGEISVFELCFDIDYLFRWVRPRDGEDRHFRYWIAPCTLVFSNVHNLRFEAETSGNPPLHIDDVSRTNALALEDAEPIYLDAEWEWTFDLGFDGEIVFFSDGYRQYVRQGPVFSDSYLLESSERGGCSFERGYRPGSSNSAQ